MAKKQKTEAFRCSICDEVQHGSSKIWASYCRWCWSAVCWECIDDEYTCILCDIDWRLAGTHISIDGAKAANRSNSEFKMKWDKESQEDVLKSDWRHKIDLAWAEANHLRTLEMHNKSGDMTSSRK